MKNTVTLEAMQEEKKELESKSTQWHSNLKNV
jgi:hypothetical protein